MLIIRTAFKNILAGGKRTWLNVAVLSFSFVIMVLLNGTKDGWLDEARRDTISWETGAGQLWHPEYDRYDVFSLQEAHGTPPSEVQSFINNGIMTPVLVTQGEIYPQGRMQNVLLKGIDSDQKIINIPSKRLQGTGTEITAVIGRRTAKAANLNAGDRVMLRWRDRNGAFDAREILIADVFDTKVPGVDAGQVWLSLNDLQQMTGMPGEATYLVKSADCTLQNDMDGWMYKDLNFLMADLEAMNQGQQIESAIIFIVLLSIALLAVFDTQMLSIFRRQKEIGTYIALGMTPGRVMRLFTLEGTCYSVLAIVVGTIWGMPILAWLAKNGIKMPDMVDDMGVAFGDALYPLYRPSSVLVSIIVVVVLSALISFLPARKIAKQDVVNALKGKIN